MREDTLANRRRYARVARLYDLLDYAFEPLYQPGRALVGQQATGLTLEIGAGTGKNFPFYRPAARVVASDLSWPMLVRARRRLSPPVHALLLADAARLPLREATFETVVATFVCCVQADPSPALEEIARAVQPGGRVVLLEYTRPPEPRWLRTVMRLLLPPLRAVYGVHWEHDVPGLLQAAGLSTVQVRSVWGQVVQCIIAAKPSAAG